jgi:ubiquinone/menaquinone biosynthesis C-methylase UbiE
MLTMLRKIKRLIKPIKPNTIENNLQMWSDWDWSNYGEEWSNNLEWKNSLIERVFKPNVPVDSRILEIGPGAGRWTEHLVKRARLLTLVDLTPKCIELCKERFSEFNNIEYFINDGKDLSFISSESIDCIWSWDVFVHIQSGDIRDYILQFARVLAPGGRGIIHHSKRGKSDIGWRSDMTAEKMKTYCEEFGLKVIKQFDSWDNGRFVIWPKLPAEKGPDIISVFIKS